MVQRAKKRERALGPSMVAAACGGTRGKPLEHEQVGGGGTCRLRWWAGEEVEGDRVRRWLGCFGSRKILRWEMSAAAAGTNFLDFSVGLKFGPVNI